MREMSFGTFRVLPFLLAAIVSCAEREQPNVQASVADPEVSLTRDFQKPRSGARIFISGHSLVDQPLPDFLTGIARSAGTPMEWNRQYVVGSSILRRTRGEDRKALDWPGYRNGYNREGEKLDVIAEFLRPQTVSGGPYDVLLITEQHGMLETLLWNDTVRHLRHYHDRFIDGNPQGDTYFYEPWLDVGDKSDPRRWIAYERAVSPIWQCMATRVNVSLKAEGRSDRLTSLPAGAALAELLARATGGSKLDGITRGSDRETVDSIIDDAVHLTRLGSYYVSLVTYSAIFRRSPIGGWAPAHVSDIQAKSLQQTAWDFISAYYANYRPLSLTECRIRLKEEIIGSYWAYVRDVQWRDSIGSLRAYLRWLRRSRESRNMLERDDVQNPFYFDPANDRAYWLDSP